MSPNRFPGGAEQSQVNNITCVASAAVALYALLQFNNKGFCNAGGSATADCRGSAGIRPDLRCVALHQVLMLRFAQHFVLQNY